MYRARIFLITLVTVLSITIVYPAVAGASQDNTLSSQETPLERVDGTDFPVLYLTNPQLRGDAVWMVQARLKELGYEIEPDGVFSEATSELVRLFQTANNMEANGKVSQEVWESLMSDEAEEACLTQAEGENKISIEIDIVKHRLTVFSDGQEIKKYPVGVGKGSTPSPVGEWKIVRKSLNTGGPFGSRFMGLNVPWGVYGVHGTNQPYSVGQSLSHGCIRMRNKDVEALYPLVRVGTTVKIVANGKIVPSYFKGRNLQRKSYGQDVVYLQCRLKEKGVIFDNADGRYGMMTELAVKYYQTWHGLNPSGKADKELYKSLSLIK